MKNWIHNLYKRLRKLDEKGFSYIENVLYISLAAILFGLTSQIMISTVDNFDWISKNQTTVTDARYSLNRISSDLLKVTSTKLLSISNNSIQFVDEDGQTTGYSTAVINGKTALLRGTDVLLPEVSNLTFQFYDDHGNTTNSKSDVAQFKILLVTGATGATDATELSTRVTPRAVLYANYN